MTLLLIVFLTNGLKGRKMKALFLIPLLVLTGCVNGQLQVCKYSVQARAAFVATIESTGVLIDDLRARNEPVPKELLNANIYAVAGLVALNSSCPPTPSI